MSYLNHVCVHCREAHFLGHHHHHCLPTNFPPLKTRTAPSFLSHERGCSRCPTWAGSLSGHPTLRLWLLSPGIHTKRTCWIHGNSNLRRNAVLFSTKAIPLCLLARNIQGHIRENSNFYTFLPKLEASFVVYIHCVFTSNCTLNIDQWLTSPDQPFPLVPCVPTVSSLLSFIYMYLCEI